MTVTSAYFLILLDNMVKTFLAWWVPKRSVDLYVHLPNEVWLAHGPHCFVSLQSPCLMASELSPVLPKKTVKSCEILILADKMCFLGAEVSNFWWNAIISSEIMMDLRMARCFGDKIPRFPGGEPPVLPRWWTKDQSDAGCYCSDEELRDLLRSLPPLPPPSAATVPPPRAAVPVPGTVPGAPVICRSQYSRKM